MRILTCITESHVNFTERIIIESAVSIQDSEARTTLLGHVNEIHYVSSRCFGNI